MPFIPAVNVAEVVILQSLAGQDVFNVENFLFPGPFVIADMHILATEINNAWHDFIFPLISQDIALVGAKVTDITTATAPSITQLLGTPETGGISQDSVPNNTALVVSEGTDSRGRSFRGRLYGAGMPVTNLQDSSHVTIAYLGDYIDAWTAFFDQVHDNAGVDHVIVSRYTGGAARATAVMTEITQYSGNTELDSMRSRLAGRGS